MIGHIGVVIPARDEEQRISRCLESIAIAAELVQVPVTIIVVADGCVDRTAELATQGGAIVIPISAHNVGLARATGAAAAIARGADWLANTDADSVVPVDWLSAQKELADEGADVVAGTVRPDFVELTAGQRAAWLLSHGGDRAVGNVYGANLGVRVETYLRSGGYRPIPEHEDNDLVTRLATEGVVMATSRAEVTTSGRLVGRTPGGFAGYLRERLLGEQLMSEGELTA